MGEKNDTGNRKSSYKLTEDVHCCLILLILGGSIALFGSRNSNGRHCKLYPQLCHSEKKAFSYTGWQAVITDKSLYFWIK